MSARNFLSELLGFAGFGPVRRPSRELVAQISQSLRLHPVSFASQAFGALCILIFFWGTISRPLLACWACSVILSITCRASFGRAFSADRERESNIRRWIRISMALATVSGAIWGFAGVFFLSLDQPVDQMALVAIVVAVVFASWPAYSCWLPELSVFTLLSLVPVLLGLASAYNIGRAVIGLVVAGLICFVLYSGKRFNEIVGLSVSREEQNARLVARLKAEKMMAESSRRAVAAASERRTRFLAGANHDLRQPLQAMGIYLQLLKMQAGDNNRQVIGQLDVCAGNISNLVEQILEASRIEMGAIEPKYERISVTELFESLAGEFTAIASGRGLVFSIRPVEAEIETDQALVTRILTNFLSNAIAYSDKPGGKVILAARRRPEGRIILAVYDEGQGITRSERRKIFDYFYRGSAGRTAGTGYGLGLSIARALAAMLSAPVTVGSRPGRGSVFRIEFAEAPASGGHAASRTEKIHLSCDFRISGTVGLLEDSIFVRDAVSAALSEWGAEVAPAERPTEEFLERIESAARQGRLAAVITDYNLGPEEPTGLDFVFMLSTRLDRKIPAVLLTAVDAGEIRAAYRQLILNPDNRGQPLPVILQKPASPQQLAAAVTQASAEVRT